MNDTFKHIEQMRHHSIEQMSVNTTQSTDGENKEW